MTRRDDTADIRKDIADLGEAIAGGHAELRHDNAELRREVLAAVNGGFGGLRDENRELRQSVADMRAELAGVREEAQRARTEIEALRREAAEARAAAAAKPEQEAAAGEQDAGEGKTEEARQPRLVVSCTPPATAKPTASTESDVDDFEALLGMAAGVAFAELVCHRDTWAFVVEQVAKAEHFRLPADISERPDGAISVELSGRSLIAALSSLWDVQHDQQATVGTQRLAEQIYERIGAALQRVEPTDGAVTEGAESREKHPVARIIVDDRPALPEASDAA